MPSLLVKVVPLDPDGGGEFRGLYPALELGFGLLGRLNVLPEELLQSCIELVEFAAHHPQMIPVVLCSGRWGVEVEGCEGNAFLLQGSGNKLSLVEQGGYILDHFRAGLVGVEVGFLLCHSSLFTRRMCSRCRSGCYG